MTLMLAPRLSVLHAPMLTTLPSAVAANVARVRQATDAAIMAVVKADGYGHGAVPVARAAIDAGATWLGVTDAADAAPLRDAGLDVPILAWLNPSGVDVAQLARDRVDIAVGSVDELRRLVADIGDAGAPVDVGAAGNASAAGAPDDSAGEAVRVHLHVDTGMSRGGCPVRDWAELLRVARSAGGLIEIVGVMGHLPRADEADPQANAAAVRRMRHARDTVLRAGFGPLIVHLAATAGALTDPSTHFDLVRIGAGLVGIDPSETVTLAGASRLTASVVHSAFVHAGTAIGYGGTYVTGHTTNLSVIGLGYADGIPRELAEGAGVEIGGSRHPIVGRVSMDQVVVDTGARSYPRGTAVTVFGPEGAAVPSVQDWARWAGTIPHTIVVGIGARVRRSEA